MKTFKKVHESKDIANKHITKIKKRGGTVKKTVKKGKILLEYSFPVKDKSVNIFDNVKKSDAFDIYDASVDFLKKDWKDRLIPYIQNYLHSEFKWGKDNEVIDVLNKDNTFEEMLLTIIPYHEVIEWLHHRGSTDYWDISHPISVEITGNRLKQIIKSLDKYSNNDIQVATEYLIQGYQITGNSMLDDDAFHIKKEELTQSQLKIVNILNRNKNEIPLFTTIDELLKYNIKQYKLKF